MLSSQDKNTKDANKQRKSINSYNTKEWGACVGCLRCSIVSTWSPPLWIVSLSAVPLRSCLFVPHRCCFSASCNLNPPRPHRQHLPRLLTCYFFPSPPCFCLHGTQWFVFLTGSCWRINVCTTWCLVFDSTLSVGHLWDHNFGCSVWIHVCVFIWNPCSMFILLQRK